MRHLKSGRKLNRTASHRKAMLSNLATSILDKERVTTSVSKAKEVRSLVERLITYGKRGGLHAIRCAARFVNSKTVLKKLFDDIAPGYKDRQGGYTRIIKKGVRRGDNAEIAIIELVGRRGDEPRKRKKRKKGGAKTAKTAAGKSTRTTAKKKTTDEEVEGNAAEDAVKEEAVEATGAQDAVVDEEGTEQDAQDEAQSEEK